MTYLAASGLFHSLYGYIGSKPQSQTVNGLEIMNQSMSIQRNLLMNYNKNPIHKGSKAIQFSWVTAFQPPKHSQTQKEENKTIHPQVLALISLQINHPHHHQHGPC